MYRSTESEERADIFFMTKEWNGAVTNKDSLKCDDLSWVNIDELPSNTLDYIEHVLECKSNNIQMSEWSNAR